MFGRFPAMRITLGMTALLITAAISKASIQLEYDLATRGSENCYTLESFQS